MNNIGIIYLNKNEYKDFYNSLLNPDIEYFDKRDKILKDINDKIIIHTDGEDWKAEIKDLDLSFIE